VRGKVTLPSWESGRASSGSPAAISAASGKVINCSCACARGEMNISPSPVNNHPGLHPVIFDNFDNTS